MKPVMSVPVQHNYPVLEGLAAAGIAGKSIAEMTDVSPPTVSKWRTGRARMPASSLVFLTLVLAHLVEEMEALEHRLSDLSMGWSDTLSDQLLQFRDRLLEQEAYNASLSPSTVNDGARQFRDWYENNASTTFDAGLLSTADFDPAFSVTSAVANSWT